METDSRSPARLEPGTDAGVTVRPHGELFYSKMFVRAGSAGSDKVDVPAVPGGETPMIKIVQSGGWGFILRRRGTDDGPPAGLRFLPEQSCGDARAV